ncbi:hypothetical protein ACVWZ8_001309 [Arthrobacter sp. UYCu723]
MHHHGDGWSGGLTVPAPLSCFVFYRRFRSEPAWRPLAGWTLATGAFLSLAVVLLKMSQQPGSGLSEWKGLVQRVLLVAFMAWTQAGDGMGWLEGP